MFLPSGNQLNKRRVNIETWFWNKDIGGDQNLTQESEFIMNKKTTIGTPLSENATRLLLMGSGELGKEVAIEAMRLGLEVVAVDRYANAPAMQIAHRAPCH